MHKLFAQLVKKHTPEVNPDIVNGLSTKMMTLGEQYLDQVFRAASRSFPEGMEYLGCERCSPQEEYQQAGKALSSSSNKRVFEVAGSDLYMMKYFFSYNGEELPPKYLYIPFVGEGNTITISNNRYVISPMLSDKVISPGNNTVFVRLLRDKIIFRRLVHSVKVNEVKRACQIVYTHLYRKNKKSKNKEGDGSTSMVTAVAHYLIAKFGVMNFFKKYFGFEPIILEGQVDLDTYNYHDYMIVSSVGIAPKGCTVKPYIKSDIKIVIPHDKYTPLVEDIVAGIFYVIDYFPDRVSAGWFNDPGLWMKLLGTIHFADSYNQGKLLEKTREHFNSLDEYIDLMIGKKLAESGYPCNDFYDLLVVIIEHFTEWVVSSSKNVNSMFGKELSVLYSVYYSITCAIFETAFKLSKIALRKRDRNGTEITVPEIKENLNKTLRTGLIFKITQGNACTTTVSYPGDSKFFKLTSNITPQTAAQRPSGSGSSRVSEEDPTNKLHPSIAVAGGYLNLPKKHPTGTTRANPYMLLDDSGTILPNPESEELIRSIEEKLSK